MTGLFIYEDDNSLLKFFELLTGELLWEKTIGTKGNDYGHLVIASFGRAIVFQDKNNTKMERFTYVLNSDGRLIWEMTKLRQPGKTNGGIVRAISDDGRFIAMSDLQEFALYAVDKINPIWIIKERMRPQYVQKYAGKVLAFRPHPNNSTRVFLLNENGTIKQDYHFLQRLEFKTPWPHKVQVIEPSQDRLDLSLIDLPINSGN